ncbi:MAG TPA: PIN domain-containing protein [Phycisphaerae bacterium]|nr:PIN domain-containing protein [Phycisphaerae bacterium]
MILLDTNILKALVDPRDGQAGRAQADLEKFGNQRLVTIAPVLVECSYLLPAGFQRRRLDALLTELPVDILPGCETREFWEEVIRWLLKYESHEPDAADASIAVISGEHRKLKIWTYDNEFRTTWRRLDGSRIPLASE